MFFPVGPVHDRILPFGGGVLRFTRALLFPPGFRAIYLTPGLWRFAAPPR